MTSTRNNSRILLDVRIIDKTDSTFTLFDHISKKVVTLLEEQESRGDWRTSQIGRDVTVSLASSLASQHGLGLPNSIVSSTPPASSDGSNING